MGTCVTKKIKKIKSIRGYNVICCLTNKSLADNPQPASLMYKFIADAYVNMGDYKGAVEAQEMAIAKAKEYLKNGKFAGFVLEDTVKEYEAALEKYKKGTK